MTHKKANDFIKKWNKELGIKGYSKMRLPEKMLLIEKRLKEVKSSMIETMKNEWTVPGKKHWEFQINTRGGTKQNKRSVKKKETPKKEAPEKKVPKDSHKKEVPKEEPKKSDSLIAKEKDILDTWKQILNPQLKVVYSNDDKDQMKKLYSKSLTMLSKLVSKYSGRSQTTELKQLKKMGGSGMVIRKWAEGKNISSASSLGVDITSLLKLNKKEVPKGSHKMPDGSIMKNSDMSSDIVVTKQPVLPKKKEEKQEKKKPVKSKTNVDRKERNKLEAQFKRTFKKTVYKVLGIPNKSNPSLQEIKTMCRKLQLANHPDKGGSVEIIASINEACNVLSSTIISDDESETGLQTILRKFTNKYDLKSVQNMKGLNDLENSYKDDLQKIRAEIAKYDQDDEDEVLAEIEKRKAGKDIVKKYFDIKNNFIEKARKKRKALIRALNKK